MPHDHAPGLYFKVATSQAVREVAAVSPASPEARHALSNLARQCFAPAASCIAKANKLHEEALTQGLCQRLHRISMSIILYKLVDPAEWSNQAVKDQEIWDVIPGGITP